MRLAFLLLLCLTAVVIYAAENTEKEDSESGAHVQDDKEAPEVPDKWEKTDEDPAATRLIMTPSGDDDADARLQMELMDANNDEKADAEELTAYIIKVQCHDSESVAYHVPVVDALQGQEGRVDQ